MIKINYFNYITYLHKSFDSFRHKLAYLWHHQEVKQPLSEIYPKQAASKYSYFHQQANPGMLISSSKYGK